MVEGSKALFYTHNVQILVAERAIVHVEYLTSIYKEVEEDLWAGDISSGQRKGHFFPKQSNVVTIGIF